MGHKPWENWVRLIYCLQDPTIHHKDLHINVPVQLYIPLHFYYNEIQLNNLGNQDEKILNMLSMKTYFHFLLKITYKADIQAWGKANI